MIESCGVVWRPRNLQNMYCIWVADTQFSIIKNRAKVVDSGVLEGTPLSATTAFFLNGDFLKEQNDSVTNSQNRAMNK